MKPVTVYFVTLVFVGVFLAPHFNMAEGFKIGAFNIQVFGTKKSNNADIMSVLARIVRRYDIILIQEIRDKTGRAVEKLLAEANKYSGRQHKYKMILSDRLGRTASKEQYAFFYRSAYGITVLDSYHYNDGDEAKGTDTFQREPFVVRFHIPQLAVQEVAMVAIHTDPDDAVAETKALTAVIDDAIERWGTDDVIVLGDLNTDCKAFPKKYWKDLTLRKNSKYFWPIGDSIDTTTGPTDCAYDRFVLTGQKLRSSYVEGSAGVYRFDKSYKLDKDETMAVSDHYPIELELYLDDPAKGQPGTSGQDVDDVSNTGCTGRFLSLCSCACAAFVLRFFRSLHLGDGR